MAKTSILWACLFAALVGHYISGISGALLGVGAVLLVTLRDWWPL